MKANAKSRKTKFVTVYAVTRHWGGSEEGGWWWNRYEAIFSRRVPAGAAVSARVRLDKKWEKREEGDLNSVLGGVGFSVRTEARQFENEQLYRPSYE